MKIFKQIAPLTDELFSYHSDRKSIGFVPTMGALHAGHLELIEEAKRKCDVVVCSIYVNPTQFDKQEDLQKYPRTIDADLKLLEETGCDIVFYPSDEVMYAGASALSISFGALETVMEGKHRAGHFNGVALVVSKLFNIVKPDVAFFGQKDLQQFAIIEQLTRNLMFDIELVCVPVVRESSGLAMSSRNVRLSEQGKLKATILHQSLLSTQQMLLNGNTIAEAIENATTSILNKGVDLEYFSVVDKLTLQEIEAVENKENVAICVAGFVDGVRLIDNMLLI